MFINKWFSRLCFIIIVLLPYLAEAQYSKATGIIYEARSGKPLAFANVVLLNTRFGTVSDSDGRFQISNIPSGIYTIQVSYIGYNTFRKQVNLSKHQELNLSIFLNDTISFLKEIPIKAEHKDTTKYSNRMHIIPVQKIDNMPVQSIAEALDYLPGVTINNTFGVFSSKTTVTMRGLPANNQGRVLVLLDGFPLNKSDEGSVNWNLINKSNIETVKVFKGPGPAMYGSGSMGGVIEMISKKPVKKFAANVILDYGTYNTVGINLNMSGLLSDSGILKQVYWGISSSGKKSDGYISEIIQDSNESDSILAPVFLREMNTTAKLGYNFRKNQNIEIQIGYFDDKRGNGFQIYDIYGSNSEHDTYLANAKYSGSVKNISWSLISFFSHENYKRLYEYLKDGEYQLYGADSKREDQGINANLSCEYFRFHKITTGLNYRLGSVNGADIYYTSTDIISNAGKMAMYAAFIQDEISLFHNKLLANIGLRYEYASFYDGLFKIDFPSYSIAFYSNFTDTLMQTKHWDALCPKFSIEYLLKGKNRIYFAAAKGFTAPILDDLCRTGKRKGGFKIANPNLEPETLTNFEFGFDKEFKKSFQTSASVFYSVGRDFMYYISTGDSVNMGYRRAPILQRDNISGVKIIGFETELKYDLKEKLSFFLNYSYSFAQITKHLINNPLVDVDLTGKQLTDLPNHKASAGFIWKTKFLNASFLYKYIGKTWINDQNTTDTVYFKSDKLPGYNIFSIRFDKNITQKFFIFINIENIFNKIYITTDFQRPPGRFITAGLKYSI